MANLKKATPTEQAAQATEVKTDTNAGLVTAQTNVDMSEDAEKRAAIVAGEAEGDAEDHAALAAQTLKAVETAAERVKAAQAAHAGRLQEVATWRATLEAMKAAGLPEAATVTVAKQLADVQALVDAAAKSVEHAQVAWEHATAVHSTGAFLATFLKTVGHVNMDVNPMGLRTSVDLLDIEKIESDAYVALKRAKAWHEITLKLRAAYAAWNRDDRDVPDVDKLAISIHYSDGRADFVAPTVRSKAAPKDSAEGGSGSDGADGARKRHASTVEVLGVADGVTAVRVGDKIGAGAIAWDDVLKLGNRDLWDKKQTGAGQYSAPSLVCGKIVTRHSGPCPYGHGES